MYSRKMGGIKMLTGYYSSFRDTLSAWTTCSLQQTPVRKTVMCQTAAATQIPCSKAQNGEQECSP